MGTGTQRDQATIAKARAELERLANGFGSEDPEWVASEQAAWRRVMAQAQARISQRAF